MRDTNEKFGELEKLQRKLDYRDAQLAERDRMLLQLNRKLRILEALQYILGNRTAELAEKEREVSDLKIEVARRNNRLARLELLRKRNL